MDFTATYSSPTSFPFPMFYIQGFTSYIQDSGNFTNTTIPYLHQQLDTLGAGVRGPSACSQGNEFHHRKTPRRNFINTSARTADRAV